MLINNEKKSNLIIVCAFMCGLVVGGLLVYLVDANKSENVAETASGHESDYAQVYGIDVSFWQGNIHWDQLSLPCDESGIVSGNIPAPRHQRPKLEPGDLPPVLDVEIDSPEIVTKAREWLEIVEKECGVKAIIYTNMHVYNNRIKNCPLLNPYDLWLAKPRGVMPDVPKCKFWQFTHEGHVWGIIDNVVDINMFNGTKEQLDEYIQVNGIKGNKV